MRIRAITACEAADAILTLVATGPSVVFVGAFVSSRSPSCLPMAVPLKQAIALSMHSAGKPLLVSAFCDEPLALLSRSRFSDVPLELLAEEVIKKTDLTITDLLGWLADSQPNMNHRVLAALSDQGMATVATTNFDELIESLATQRDRVVKLHGTVSNPESMVMRLSQVGRGLVDRRFRRLLGETLAGKSVCFIGYAGRDPDIFPALMGLRLKRVLWIARPFSSAEDQNSIANELAHCGRLEAVADSFDCVSVDANSVFDELGAKLALRPVAGGAGLDWESAFAKSCRLGSSDTAAIAFARLLSASGLWEHAAKAYAQIASESRLLQARCDSRLYGAEAHYWLGDYDLAKASAKEAERSYRVYGNRLGEARACQILGLIASRSISGKTRSWSPRYMKRVSRLLAAERSSDALIVSTNNYLNFGIWLKNKGDLSGAEATLEQGLRLARGSGDVRCQEKLHHALGIVLRRRRQSLLSLTDFQVEAARAARKHLKRAEELAVYLGATSEEVRVLSTRINLELDGIEYVRGATPRARQLIQKFEVMVAGSWEPEQYGRLHEFKGILMAAERRFGDSVAAFTRALDIVQTNTAKASCLRGRAAALYMLGNPVQASADVQAAMKLTPIGPERQQIEILAKSISQGRGPVTQPKGVSGTGD